MTVANELTSQLHKSLKRLKKERRIEQRKLLHWLKLLPRYVQCMQLPEFGINKLCENHLLRFCHYSNLVLVLIVILHKMTSLSSFQEDNFTLLCSSRRYPDRVGSGCTFYWRYKITFNWLWRLTTSAQVVKTSVNATNKSSFQNYTKLDGHSRQTLLKIQLFLFFFLHWHVSSGSTGKVSTH